MSDAQTPPPPDSDEPSVIRTLIDDFYSFRTFASSSQSAADTSISALQVGLGQQNVETVALRTESRAEDARIEDKADAVAAQVAVIPAQISQIQTAVAAKAGQDDLDSVDAKFTSQVGLLDRYLGAPKGYDLSTADDTATPIATITPAINDVKKIYGEVLATRADGLEAAIYKLAALARLTPASDVLTLAAVPTADDTITLGNDTYTFKASASAAYEVTIGSAAESRANLIAEVNGLGLASANALATMVAAGGNDIEAVAIDAGPDGNSIVATASLTDGGDGWAGSGTLSGGTPEKATGTLTFTGQPLDTETVVIGSKTYTFQTTLTGVDGNVQIGASAEASIDNLVAAITLTGTPGTDYADLMTVHPSVTAAKSGTDKLVATALAEGTAGNVASTETLTNASWGGATLSGGTDIIVDDATTDEHEDVAGWDCSVVGVGYDIQVQVTGDANAPVNWKATVQQLTL